MSATVSSSKQFSIKGAAFWAVKILLALMFFAFAGFKLSGQPMMVKEFAEVGLGQWFRYVTGLLELTGAVLLLWPGRTAYGAGLLACVCTGAFFAQLLFIHVDVIHTIVLTAIFVTITWFHRYQLPALK
jgi:uncharacterized membrane protein YphA (DoxX/SURF4 family)